MHLNSEQHLTISFYGISKSCTLNSILTVCVPQPEAGPSNDELYLHIDYRDFQIAPTSGHKKLTVGNAIHGV